MGIGQRCVYSRFQMVIGSQQHSQRTLLGLCFFNDKKSYNKKMLERFHNIIHFILSELSHTLNNDNADAFAFTAFTVLMRWCIRHAGLHNLKREEFGGCVAPWVVTDARHSRGKEAPGSPSVPRKGNSRLDSGLKSRSARDVTQTGQMFILFRKGLQAGGALRSPAIQEIVGFLWLKRKLWGQ